MTSSQKEQIEIHEKKILDLKAKYPSSERKVFLLWVNTFSVEFLNAFFITITGWIQIDGWPPERPGRFFQKRPILTTGYILLFIAFTIQLWYAIELFKPHP